MRWLPYLNAILVVTLISVGAFFFFFSRGENEILTIHPRIERSELPKSAFSEPEDHDLGTGPFALNWVPPLMQLPDLRGELQFFGQNGRPDATSGKPAYHLGLKGSGEVCSVQENGRIYLVYSEGGYTFSPDNQPTPLWLEICASGANTLSLYVKMLDEKGGFVSSPQPLRQLTLSAQEFPRSQTMAWELGGYRVDSTLLVRQKARWIGSDRFLEMHGGDEYIHTVGRERIDFLSGETLYSCFIGLGDFLVWKNERWHTPMKGESSEGLPILCVRKIDEKIMSLELWDGPGRSKANLSLIRAKDHNKMPNLSQEFKFVGAKTWAQFIVECRKGGRLILKPNDWLVLTQEGWKKLESAEQIDEYVGGSLVGPLFILDKRLTQNGRQVLVGHLFNLTRTEVEEIELEASTNNSLANFYRAIPLEPPIKPILLEGTEE